LGQAGVTPEDGGALVEKVKSAAKAGLDAFTKPPEKAARPHAPTNRIGDSPSRKKPRAARPAKPTA